MKMKAKDGKLYAEVTLRDVVENYDVSDLPMLTEIKRLYDENAKLRELMRIMHGELVSCEDNGYVCGGHKFDERVRELGIEVQP